MTRLENVSKESASDVLPNKIFDFVKFEKTNAHRQ